MKTYGEMDEELQDVLVWGLMYRMGTSEGATREYLEQHPEFDPSCMSYMKVGDDQWYTIMRDMLWGDKTDEEIEAICEGS